MRNPARKSVQNPAQNLPQPHPVRHPGLDTLRALAIVAVMFFHRFWQVLPESWTPVSDMGWMGVDLFFVLSGYLIGAQLLRPYLAGKPSRLWEFYRKRLYRVLPAYAVVLALYFLVPAWREDTGLSPLWEFLTFTENLFVDYSVNYNFSHVWSLCVEEHFYLILPVIVLLLMRRPRWWKTGAGLVSVLLLGIAVRGFVVLHALQPLARAGHDWKVPFMERLYYPTWTRLDGLLAGVTLAVLEGFRPLWWKSMMGRGHLLLLGATGMIAAAVWMLRLRWESVFGLPAVGDVFGFPILSVGLGLLVASALSRNGLLRFKVPGANFIAMLAYCLYLTHKEVYQLTSGWLPGLREAGGWPWFAAAMGACLVAAAILHLAVERPFLILRDRAAGKRHASIESTIEAEPAL